MVKVMLSSVLLDISASVPAENNLHPPQRQTWKSQIHSGAKNHMFIALSSNSREHVQTTKYHPVTFERPITLCYPSMQRMIKSWLLLLKTSDKEVNHSFAAMTALSKASEGTNSILGYWSLLWIGWKLRFLSTMMPKKSIMWRHQQIFIHLTLAWLHKEARNT